MHPRFKALSSISVYVPDLQQALDAYLALGLEPCAPFDGASADAAKVELRFPDGGAGLTLHSDPQRQFVELSVRVDDVHEAYRRLARQPDHTWLETPTRDGAGWRAVVRLPDDNVFTLRSTNDASVALTLGERRWTDRTPPPLATLHLTRTHNPTFRRRRT